MSLNADFVRLAHRRAVLNELQRILLDKYVASDSPAVETIVSDEVPYKDREVPNAAVLEVLEEIQQLEMNTIFEMRQFEHKKRKNEQQQQPNAGAAGNADGKPSSEESSGQKQEGVAAPSGPELPRPAETSAGGAEAPIAGNNNG